MELDAIINQAQSQIDAAEDAATLDQVRVEFMGKKGKRLAVPLRVLNRSLASWVLRLKPALKLKMVFITSMP